MRNYLIQSVIVLVCVITSFLCAAQTTCHNVTDGKDDGGSCRFRDSTLCGWRNINGDDLEWEFEDYTSIGTNSYMTLSMAKADMGDKGFFGSPILCATGNDLHSLRFRYSIQYSNRCLLSVHLVNSVNSTEIWSTKDGTGNSFSAKVDPVLFRCSGGPFQIVFVGEKLKNNRCGSWYNNQISLDSIEYTSLGPSSTSGSQCPALWDTTTTPVFTTTTTAGVQTTTHDSGYTGTSQRTTAGPETNLQTGADDGLSGGAIAGIVVVVIILIIAAVLIVAVLLVRRRRAKETQKSNPTPMKHSMSITNSVYMISHSPHSAGTGRSNIIPSAATGSSQANGRLSSPHYDEVAGDIYSDPDDLDDDELGAPKLRPSAPPYDVPSQPSAPPLDPYYSSPRSGTSDTYEVVAGDSEYSVAGEDFSDVSGQQPRDSECYSLATQPGTGDYYSVERPSGPPQKNGGGGGSPRTPIPSSASDEGYSLAQHQASTEGKSAAVKPEKIPRGQKKPDSSENEYVNLQEARGSSPILGGSGAGSRLQPSRGSNSGVDLYNRLDLGASPEEAAAGRTEYYNDPRGSDHYDHLKHDEDQAEVAAGDAVYRNVDFP